MRDAISQIALVGGQVVLALTIAAATAYAQTGAGSGLAGRVTDPSSAAMTGVTVTVARPDTGFERTTTTNATGDWELRFLSPGAHSISFEHAGFKTLRRDNVIVTTGQMSAVHVVLEVGNITEARGDRRRRLSWRSRRAGDL